MAKDSGQKTVVDRDPVSSHLPVLTAGSRSLHRILIFNSSPRETGHTAALLAPAAAEIARLNGFSVDQASLSRRNIRPCQNCYERCASEGRCWIEDDFEELATTWQNADGILLGTPVFTYGPPSTLYAFFQRLRAVSRPAAGRLPVPVGIVVQGGAAYSGAEITAQTLLNLCLAAGCAPISGDMPGCGQGVIGQVRDGDPLPEHLIAATERLAVRVCEMVKILVARQKVETIHLLVVHNGRVAPGREALLCGARSIPGVRVEVDEYDFGSASVAACQACTEYCSSQGECAFQDDMQAFCGRWLQADAVAWLAEASSVGASPNLRATIDRMNELRFERHFGLRQGNHMARYVKATAVLGGSGEPEAAMASIQFLRHAALLYQNVILPGYEWHRPATSNLGRRLVELASVLRSGLSVLADQLPNEYYPSVTKLGQIQPQRIGLSTGN